MEDNNEIEIKSKSVHPILCPIYTITCIFLFFFIIYDVWFGYYGKAFKHFVFCCYFVYYFLYKNKNKIAISKDFVSTHIANADDEHQNTTVSTSEIKKIIFTNNQILTFYDETDCILDFDLENYTNENIQLLLDELSKKFPIITDGDCRFTIQNNDIEKSKSQRKRTVISSVEKQGANKHTKRNLELDTQIATNDNKTNNRRLEL